MKGSHFLVLGIHDGHNAGSALLKDGQIVAAMCEERISRQKNDPGYPKKAISRTLEMAECTPDEIDLVALGTRFMHSRERFLNLEWYKRGYEEQLEDSKFQPQRERYLLEERLKERKEAIADHLGVSASRIIEVEHHQAHAAAAYFASPWGATNEKILVLTLDGSGDGICATVNIGEKGTIKRIAQTQSNASLGKIYSRITYLLGMKPWEHEFKVMGLAPYADQKGARESYKVVKELIDIEEGELTFQPKTQLSTSFCYPYLREQLEGHRFDWIAAAAQDLQEELVTKWVKNSAAYTGIGKLALGGGSFMNVKSNLRVLELGQVSDVFVFPSCADESLAIGSAYQAYADHQKGSNARAEPLGPIYFGPEFSDEEIQHSIANVATEYDIEFRSDIEDVIARLLASGEIVARFAGRMEWGARALGNRSILLDPRNTGKLRELNAAIKQRDFWMPFAPTILAEREHDYLLNPKGIKAPYMIVAFNTTSKGQQDLRAAIHPYDLTVRAQILERQTNPRYYDLIKRFEAITGVGGVLNTSFNLHGEPMVCSPEDALLTFESSGLTLLALGNYLIRKKQT